jgi:hypothetical protein
MPTQIKTWQIVDGQLRAADTTLTEQGRREAEHLENWIASEPSILGTDIVLIGRQVPTRSGPLDLLGIDRSGNAVIIELKRERLPREVLAQAIDYASDVATWSVDRLSEVCAKYTGKSLDELLSRFEDLDIANLTINESQRILLVGFGVDGPLERMVEWLSGSYGVNVNAIVLQYTRTTGGDELLTRTAIVSEEEEQGRIKRAQFKIPMSDEPGQYDDSKLRENLRKYLSSDLWSARRIRDVLLPACLENEKVNRGQLVQEFLRRGAAPDQTSAGRFVSLISSQLSMAWNDFLRQVIGFDKNPESPWQKDSYYIRPGYRELVEAVVAQTQVAPENSV